MSDKTDHDNVPVHSVLSQKEATEVLSKMNLKPENLPKLMSTDPQVVKVSGKPGDVIRVIRKDFGNEYKYYRLVEEE